MSALDASEVGYRAWSFDGACAVNTQILTAGTLNVVRLWLDEFGGVSPIASVSTVVATAGATLTNVGFALYSAAGALLTSSVNANGATATAFQTVGLKVVTFTSQNISPGSFYVAFWTTGTTQPTLAGGSTRASMNGPLATPNLRFATANTGLTTTAPSTLGAQTGAPTALWVAAA